MYTTAGTENELWNLSCWGEKAHSRDNSNAVWPLREHEAKPGDYSGIQQHDVERFATENITVSALEWGAKGFQKY